MSNAPPPEVWAAVSGMTVGEAWLRRDEPKSPELLARYDGAVAQLERGVPFAYAVGSAGFRALDLKIDRRALIPRPETEGLVELVLARCSGGLVADIGTGSGCIALALAIEIDERRADAIHVLGRDYGWNVEIHADLFGCPRYALATPGHGPGANTSEE